ncbi:MAG: hypothetical protein ACLR6B_18120 [Blautia sp.]
MEYPAREGSKEQNCGSRGLKRRLTAALAALLITTLAVVSATYAWFTTNRQVSTSMASARTGTESLTLEVSSSGGSAFRNQSNAPITQVNEADVAKLLPVSTADLVNFVYSPSTVDDQAVHFEKLDRESTIITAGSICGRQEKAFHPEAGWNFIWISRMEFWERQPMDSFSVLQGWGWSLMKIRLLPGSYVLQRRRVRLRNRYIIR